MKNHKSKITNSKISENVIELKYYPGSVFFNNNKSCVFWIMIIDNSVYGSPPNARIDDNINQLVQQLEKLKALKLRTTGELEEYNPTYGTTFNRVMKRGYIISQSDGRSN